MRLLVCYGKIGPARFASHRDLARAFERGLRRAEIPMAYSSGFNPHQRVSYVNPAPTGAQSRAELLVLALADRVDPDEVRLRLDAAMPAGVPVLSVQTSDGDVHPEASFWRVELPGTPAGLLASAVQAFQAADHIEVCRETKKGLRSFDVLPAVIRLLVEPDLVEEPMAGQDPAGGPSAAGADGNAANLLVLIRHTEPLVRPDDLVAALRACAAGLPGAESSAAVPPVEPGVAFGEPLATRLAQGTVVDLSEMIARRELP